MSNNITCEISEGDLSHKPGWVRMSIHPTTTNSEINYVCDAIIDLAHNFEEWGKDYVRDQSNNEFAHKFDRPQEFDALIQSWFH